MTAKFKSYTGYQFSGCCIEAPSYAAAIDAIGKGRNAFREPWDANVCLFKGPIGTDLIMAWDAVKSEVSVYTPTAEDAEATDWILV